MGPKSYGRIERTTKPLKLGLLSAASYGYQKEPRTSGSTHGTAFATTFNGWDETKAKQFNGKFVRSGRMLDAARVVKIWDPDKDSARAIADICGIDTVTDTAEQCCHNVDAVLIVDDGSGTHWKYADYPLRQGVPTFCDKPLAMTVNDATKVVKTVRNTGTPFMSASALRFVPDIVHLRQELPDIGDVHMASAVCGNELVYYGIHALSMLYAVLGKGALSTINVGSTGKNIVRIRFEKDRDGLLIVSDKKTMRSGFQINLYGQKGWRSIIPDMSNYYSYLLEAFLEFVITGNEIVPVEEELEVIAVLEASKLSLQTGREVQLSELL